MITLESQVRQALLRAETGSILWSAAHHGSGILSIVASAAAAFIAATNETALPGTAATQIAALSGAAATLTAIRTFSGCAGKWRANRKTRRALQDLQLELREMRRRISASAFSKSWMPMNVA